MESTELGRIAGALVSPVKTFASIAERPTWVVVLLVTVAVGAGVNWIATGKIDFAEETRTAIEARNSNATEAQIEQAIEVQEKFGRFFALAGAIVIGPLILLLMALVFWVLLKVVGGELPYKTAFSTTLHGLLPSSLVQVALTVPVVLARAEVTGAELRRGVVMSNLAPLAPEESGPRLVALLSSFDLFSFWAMALLVVGFSFAARVSRGKAAAVVVGLWVVYLAGKTVLAGLFG